MSNPYRTPEEIAEEIPPAPKKRAPLAGWIWGAIVLLGAVVALGAIVDVYAQLPRFHGTLVGVGVAVGIVGFGGLMRILWEAI